MTDLISRIRAGDRQAFETVAEAHYESLVRYAYRYIRDLPAAEDLVQDTLLAIWVNRARMVVTNSIASYLFGAVRNRALNYARHRKVELRWETHLSDEQSAVDSIAFQSETAEKGNDSTFESYVTSVREVIARLPARQAEAFTLRVLQEMSFAEIAEVMGLSLRSAQTTYLRAVQFLRAQLAPYRDE